MRSGILMISYIYWLPSRYIHTYAARAARVPARAARRPTAVRANRPRTHHWCDIPWAYNIVVSRIISYFI